MSQGQWEQRGLNSYLGVHCKKNNLEKLISQ